MKVTAQENRITFDFENGYTISAEGEPIGHRRFSMYLDQLENFDPPHQDEMVSVEQLQQIVQAGENPASQLCPVIEFD